MIDSLTLTNFKPFQNQPLTFRPLTLLSGLNSTGKSSVLQALLLLRQSYQKGLLLEKGLVLNGDLINIGTAKDAIFEGAAKQDELIFEIHWQNGTNSIWKFKNEEEDIGSNFLHLTSEYVDSQVYELSSLFNQNFHYIEAERIGPRAFNQMSYDKVQLLGTLGARCEYTLHFLSVNEKRIIANHKLSHPNVKSSQPQYSE
ncbi:MAG: AAA family ATPase [Tolypothrix brevis GSE-NOS-MK-07-07A]|jgi:predicted ATPase|nr:AAA family ATPase [Tolypothrix brevis GSE-NOS-MK-07-07A]